MSSRRMPVPFSSPQPNRPPQRGYPPSPWVRRADYVDAPRPLLVVSITVLCCICSNIHFKLQRLLVSTNPSQIKHVHETMRPSMTVRESCKRAIKVFPRSVVTGRTGQSRRLFSASSPLRSSLKIEADPRRRRQQCLTTHGQDPEVVGRVRPSPCPLFRGRYPASMAVLRRVEVPGLARPRWPTAADRSAPRGRRPSSAFRHRAEHSTMPRAACR